MSKHGRSSKSSSPRSNRRGLHTALQRYLAAAASLGLYLLCAVYYLFDNEDPAQDYNVLLVTLGAAIISALGALVGPYLPLLLKGARLKPKKPPVRSRNRQPNK